MKQLRRLALAPPRSAYDRLQRGAPRYADILEAAARAIERERPELIVSDGDAVLVAEPSLPFVRLHYAFPGRDAFVAQFPALLERLLPALRGDETPMGLWLRLTDMASRPYLEPVLFANAFEVSRDWLRMTLTELPDDAQTGDEVAPGFALREARPGDAQSIAELDAAAFPMPILTALTAQSLASQAPLFRLLEDVNARKAIGYLHLRHDGSGGGFVSDIALQPDYQGRGLGEATMRWALRWFHTQGLRRAALTVNSDNARAIALYRKLGFVTTETGLDYRRPLDEDEVRQAREKRRGVHIRMRHRY